MWASWACDVAMAASAWDSVARCFGLAGDSPLLLDHLWLAGTVGRQTGFLGLTGLTRGLFLGLLGDPGLLGRFRLAARLLGDPLALQEVVDPGLEDIGGTGLFGAVAGISASALLHLAKEKGVDRLGPAEVRLLFAGPVGVGAGEGIAETFDKPAERYGRFVGFDTIRGHARLGQQFGDRRRQRGIISRHRFGDLARVVWCLIVSDNGARVDVEIGHAVSLSVRSGRRPSSNQPPPASLPVNRLAQ